MNCKIFIIFFIIFLSGCAEHKFDKGVNTNIERKYINSGFTLIYNDTLLKLNKVSKKIDNRSLLIFHSSIKKGSFVKIVNPHNNKFLIAKIKSNKVEFSNFYNSVITSRIAEVLELDSEIPFIKIILISNNSTFVAKRAKTFEEEKKIAGKMPVDNIQINDLKTTIKSTSKNNENLFLYSIKIADFYYEDSAINMVKLINKETSLKNTEIIKLSNTKFRVLLGPFNDIKTLKKSFNKIKSLNFENLEIIKNV